MCLIDPSGQEHLSDVSGLGGADSTCPDYGDNRRMNVNMEFAPYLPGADRIEVITNWHGSPQAAEVEFTASSEPR